MTEQPNDAEQPGGQEPDAEPPQTEQPEAETPEPAQPEAEAPEAEESEPEQPQAETPEAEEPETEASEGAAADEEPEEAEQPKSAAPAAAGDAEPKKDVVPGAELEPIALEPERELDAEERARLEAEEEERRRREAEEMAGDEPVARKGPRVELSGDARIQATGKRKSSIARVLIRPGSGGFEINQRELDEYFPRQYLRTMVRQPLVTAGYEDAVDIQVRVHGGGVSGQAGAVRHGVARALCDLDPELRPELKRRGLLTRDARRKERRKAGLKKARKRPQFSKR